MDASRTRRDGLHGQLRSPREDREDDYTEKPSCLRITVFIFGILYKAVNSLLGLCGLLVMVKAVAMFKAWDSEHGRETKRIPIPDLWFTWLVGSVGLYAFVAAVLAFIGTQSKIRCFLTLNVLMTIVLLLAEAGPFVLNALNVDWEAELPEDPTHELDKMKDLLQRYLTAAWWSYVTIAALQALDVIFGIILISLPMASIEDWDDTESESESMEDAQRPLLLGHQTAPLDTSAAPSAPAWPLVLSPRSGSRSSGSGAVLRYSQSMREKYGVDTESFSSYDPERQAPVIEESGGERRGCSVM